MVSRISDVPGCPGVDLELVLVPWMLVDLEADRHQCDLQRGTRVVNLLGQHIDGFLYRGVYFSDC